MHGGHQMRAGAGTADRMARALELLDRDEPRGRGHVNPPDQRRIRVAARDCERNAVGNGRDGALGQQQRSVELARVGHCELLWSRTAFTLVASALASPLPGWTH